MKFYDIINKNSNNIIDLYVDMDGVLAEYDIGNFDYNTIRPLLSNIKRIEELLKKDNINIKILTICKNNSIINAKIDWIKKYMPFFELENIIFISKEQEEFYGKSSKELKSAYLENRIDKSHFNIVIDDDNSIIKYLIENNPNVKVFQISSWID